MKAVWSFNKRSKETNQQINKRSLSLEQRKIAIEPYYYLDEKVFLRVTDLLIYILYDTLQIF